MNRKKDDTIFGVWFNQIRGPFLLLSVVLVLIGIASAHRDGVVNWVHSIFLTVGVISAHISVNLFNELSDYNTQIDTDTSRTPFSGGSGMLQSGKTSPKAVSIVAQLTLFLAGAIGFYFCVVSSWYILIFMISGGVSIRFYTSHFAKWLMGEVISGLCLGTFVVLGSYMALTGHLNIQIVFISIPPGILTTLLLLLNEFPDVEADKKGGRHHMVIHFGKERCAKIYIAGLFLTYTVILLAPFIFRIPFTVLIAMLTLPIAVRASTIVLKYKKNTDKMIPALAMNVGVVIITDLLLAIGYFL